MLNVFRFYEKEKNNKLLYLLSREDNFVHEIQFRHHSGLISKNERDIEEVIDHVHSINFQFSKTALKSIYGWVIAIIAIRTAIQVQCTDGTFSRFARIHLQIDTHFIVVQ